MWESREPCKEREKVTSEESYTDNVEEQDEGWREYQGVHANTSSLIIKIVLDDETKDIQQRQVISPRSAWVLRSLVFAVRCGMSNVPRASRVSVLLLKLQLQRQCHVSL